MAYWTGWTALTARAQHHLERMLVDKIGAQARISATCFGDIDEHHQQPQLAHYTAQCAVTAYVICIVVTLVKATCDIHLLRPSSSGRTRLGCDSLCLIE